MDNRKKTLFQIPQGTEGFYLEEAFKHRQLTREIEKLFYSWGFLPVQTPVFDFFDTYQTLLDGTARDKIYRLIDREGDLLMLRSDITLFLAKQMGLALREEDIPVRVCYSDTILRHQDSEDISRNEFFQIGAELIGKSGLHADLEILMLLVKTLTLMELDGVSLHIGSRSLFSRTFSRYPDHIRGKLINLIGMREFEEVKSVAAEQGEPSGREQFIPELYGLIGTLEDFSSFSRTPEFNRFATSEEKHEMEYICSVIRELHRIGISHTLKIDFSEVGMQPYYSGIVFQAYMKDMDSSIASGGRYDGLLGFFGFDAPSVGFSLMLRKVEEELGRPERFLPPHDRISVKDEDFADAFKKAEILRGEGKVVTL